MTTRYCPKCKSDKPLSDFSKNASRKSGYCAYCKMCANAKTAAWRNLNPDKAKKATETWRANNADKVAATILEYREKNADTLRERSRKWSSENSEKCKARQKEWRDNNKEKIKEKNAAWYAENAEKARKYATDKYKENSEILKKKSKEWRLANPEKVKEMRSAWNEANIELCRVHCQNRRARESSADGSHSADDIKNLLIMQKHKCPVCRTSIKDEYHVDHIVPLSKGGSNWKENIQLLCPPCNLTKHAKDPVAFMQEQGFLI